MKASKKWWKSKAVWAGVIAVALAGYNTAVAQFGLPPVPDFVYGILAALGVYGRVDAKAEIK